ncbi:hypothetical protein SO802_004530 [Lithocarpus litseifolius]|uniref:Uncharacterized protein n=1 Tax=Lithocarpus litseifolius TaxID=425828 RepID=A0AAW2E8I7_9ROSI
MSGKGRVFARPFPSPLPLYKEPNPLPLLGFFFTNPLPQILRKEKYLYFAFLSGEPQATFSAFLLSLCVWIGGNAPEERAKLQLLLTQKTPLTLGTLGSTLQELLPIHFFSVDGVPLRATNRVRLWREGRGDKVAENVGEALMLPEDMKHWAKWDDNSLLLNMKRKAIMVKNFCPSLIFYSSPQVDTNFIICYGYQCFVVIKERY